MQAWIEKALKDDLCFLLLLPSYFLISRFDSFYIDRKSNLYSADKVSRQSVIADNQGRDYSLNGRCLQQWMPEEIPNDAVHGQTLAAVGMAP